jgi:hypothetical protein
VAVREDFAGQLTIHRVEDDDDLAASVRNSEALTTTAERIELISE